MSNSGRQGEVLFSRRMSDAGYIVEDVSKNSEYWYKDIDFIITSPSGNTRTFEVKWDTRINQTGNLYLETANKNSKGGCGWFSFCQADFLAYGDAKSKVFYIIPMAELRARAKQLPDRQASCGADSIGQLVNLRDIADITKTI